MHYDNCHHRHNYPAPRQKKIKTTTPAKGITAGHNDFNIVEILFFKSANMAIVNQKMILNSESNNHSAAFFDLTIIFVEKSTYKTKFLNFIINWK